MTESKKKFLHSGLFENDSFFSSLARRILFVFLGNRKKIRGTNNQISVRGLLLKSKIKVKGNNNRVIIRPGGVSKRISVDILGNYNEIIIDRDTHFTMTSIACWDNSNIIKIGQNGNFGKSNIVCMEGKAITIGCGCLCSYDVEIRTSDSHAIYDFSDARINEAKNIAIGDNVWLAQRCLVFKGSIIHQNTVIGANSLVNKELEKENCIYAGTPAKCIKTDVYWTHER